MKRKISCLLCCEKNLSFNPLSANPTKWSNTLKQFVVNFPTNFLSVFDHFVKLALKGLIPELLFRVRLFVVLIFLNSFMLHLFLLSRTYIKRFVWYYLYDSQSAFKFLWRLHYHTSCSYQVHKSCSYRLFSLQQFK